MIHFALLFSLFSWTAYCTVDICHLGLAQNYVQDPIMHLLDINGPPCFVDEFVITVDPLQQHVLGNFDVGQGLVKIGQTIVYGAGHGVWLVFVSLNSENPF